MKPHSKVTQLVLLDTEHEPGPKFIALCEDGSIWLYLPLSQKHQWTLCSEMEELKYL